MTRVEIDVPDMASIGACGACMRPLIWLANLDNGRVFSVVVDERDRTRFQLHGCRPLQEPATWRDLSAVPAPDQAERNAAGRAAVEAARQALKSKSASTEGEETR